MTLKAIETFYNGYRFRSRLEARWAVFFDSIGIEYEYESEGFDLEEAGRYLPDFWLPGLDCFIEVKGKIPNELEKEKCKSLAKLSGKYVYMVFSCEPFSMRWQTIEGIHRLCGSNFYFTPNGGWDGCVSLGYCETIQNYTFMMFGEYCRYNNCSCDLGANKSKDIRLNSAYLKARQARFEHGECG